MLEFAGIMVGEFASSIFNKQKWPWRAGIHQVSHSSVSLSSSRRLLHQGVAIRMANNHYLVDAALPSASSRCARPCWSGDGFRIVENLFREDAHPIHYRDIRECEPPLRSITHGYDGKIT
ncbi:hypothetical protein OUZ56_029818 [Daphnia magna]|uniref:Uncharacterized protein n=1 Tax=Daphnia magna TaxID=35525 RepID=A0ABR0B7Y9_9CRUS|nr:hypothetical protein OUZ56_029818 [Daphnia magna]